MAEIDLLPKDVFFMLKLFLQIDHIFISRRNAQDIWKGIPHQEI